MNRYEKYKPTNIEWIGEIPEHWEVKKLKYIGESLIGITYSPDDISDEENGILVLRSSNIQNGKLAFEDCVYVNKEIKEKHFTKEGDVLLCARNGSAHLVGKSALIRKENANITWGAFMSIFRSSIGEFAYQFFNSQIFKSQTGLFSTSTINQLTTDTLNNLFVPVPLPEEQTAIANYLDGKTAQIDKLIANKQRLIELLKEERTALINKAVSDEGKKWERKKLKYVVNGKLEYGANEPSDEENKEDPRYIRITDFGDNGELRLDTFKSLPIEKARYYLLQEGDILFARSGATVGKTFQFKNYNGAACFAGYLIRARADGNQILSDFLYYFTKSNIYENWKNSIFIQATIQNIGADKYSLLEIPVPSLKEQQQIVQSIQTETQRIDNTILKIEIEIELMQEYKTALISEVVTGKQKVINYDTMFSMGKAG